MQTVNDALKGDADSSVGFLLVQKEVGTIELRISLENC
jgi:hypothetical protein